MPKPPDDIFTMPISELETRVAQIKGLFKQIAELLPGLIELPDNVKAHSVGNFRDGEAEALSGLFGVVALKPTLFDSLADEDAGDDPDAFEPELIQDRLQRAILLGELLAAGAKILAPLSDTRLHLGNLTRPVLLAMYEIVKPHAKRDPAIASKAKGAIDFFAAIARAAAATRAQKKRDK